MRIWKYEIPIEDEFTLELPEHSNILCVQAQYDKPCIWVEVGEEFLFGPKQRRYFRLAGTGHNISLLDTLRYIGTFQVLGGQFVGHLYERF